MNYILPNTAPVNKPIVKPYSVIIPAAGMGSRMKSYGPKLILDIADGVSILDNQLNHIYSNLPKSEIIIVTGFESNKIVNKVKNKKIKIVYNEQYKTTNVIHSIGLGLQNATHKDVIIIYGDLVFNRETLKAPFGKNSMIITSDTMKKDEVGCVIHNHMLERIMYGLSNKWAQIVYVCGKELKLLKDVCNTKKYENYFGFEAINIVINSGGSFSTYTNKLIQVIDIDCSKDIQYAEKII